MVLKRELFVFTLLFCAGIITASYTSCNLAIWLVLTGAAIFIAFFCFLLGAKKPLPAVFLCFFLAGGLWLSYSRYPLKIYGDMAGQSVSGVGTAVTYGSNNGFHTSFIVKVQELSCLDSKTAGINKLLLRVQTRSEDVYLPGTKVAFAGTLLIPEGGRNPGQFDYCRYLANQEVFFLVNCREEGIERLAAGGNIRNKAAAGREKISLYLEKLLPKEERSFLLGLLFGDTSGIDRAEWEGFQRAGVLHFFSVSGLHVSFVLGLLFFILSFFEPRPVWKMFWGITVLWLYYCLVGWNAPLLRASVMAVMVLYAMCIRRKPDIYTGLALAALVVLLIQPGELFQRGFQLSFIATAGIIYLAPFLENLGCGKTLAIALAAQAATLPLVACYFNQVSLIAPLMNVFTVLACSCVTVLGLTGCLLVWLFTPLAEPFFLTAGFVIKQLSSFVLWWSAFSWAGLTVASPPTLLIGAYFLVLLLLPHFFRFRPYLRKKKATVKIAAAGAVIVLLLVPSLLSPGRMEVVFLDVGQGDAIFMMTPQGKTILLDGGGTPNSTYSMGERVLQPFLRHRGITKLDLMIMSHNDIDHSEGLLEIIPYFDVGLLLTPPGVRTDSTEAEIRELCRKKGIPVRETGAGQVIELEKGVTMEILNPGKEEIADENDRSLVIRLVYGDAEWLLTGDIGKEGIARMMDRLDNPGAIRADVLKLPHHGSVSSYDVNFYEQVQPKTVIISVGKNTYGHPHPSVVQYFNECGLPVYSTEKDGAVITESDGKTIMLECYKK